MHWFYGVYFIASAIFNIKLKSKKKEKKIITSIIDICIRIRDKIKRFG